MQEDTPGTKDDAELAYELADMIRGFGELSPIYEKMALAQIKTFFAEFVRRAELGAIARHPERVAKYPNARELRAQKKSRP